MISTLFLKKYYCGGGGGGHAIEMPRPRRPKFHNLLHGCKGNSLLLLIIMLELMNE